jgi:hypothetical protein
MRSRQFVNEHRWSPGPGRESAATPRHQLLTLQSVAGNRAVATFVQRARRRRAFDRDDFEAVGADVDVDERDDLESEMAEGHTPLRLPTLGAFLDPALEAATRRQEQTATRRQEAAALEAPPTQEAETTAPPSPGPPTTVAAPEAVPPVPEVKPTAPAEVAEEVKETPTLPATLPEVIPATKEPEQTVAESPAASAPDRLAVESALRDRLATSARWAQLSQADQETVISEGMKTAIPSKEKLREEFRNAKRRVKTEAKANKKVEEYKARAVALAAEEVLPLIEKLAKQAEERGNKEKLAFDKEILRLYITSLSSSATVKRILLEAVMLLNLSNAAYGESIAEGLSEDVIRDVASRWDKMQSRVTDQRPQVPDEEGRMKDNPDRGQAIKLKIVKKMRVPGGATTPPQWKDRGPNWEKTKNLICDVHPATNNIHLHLRGVSKWPKSRGAPPND